MKSLYLFCCVCLLFISSAFFYEDQKISVLPFIPQAVKPGDEFNVQLNVIKGSVPGYACLQQYLPDGFTATVIESQGAEFVFEDHLIKFTWKNLPPEKTFSIAYKIKTDRSCNGLKTLNGLFSYIENEQPKKIQLTPSVIVMSDDAPSANKNSDANNGDIITEKTIVPITAKAGEYKVELKIKKGLKQNAVRLFDPVIEGYAAIPLETRGAKFNFVDGVAEFYWESLPTEPQFTVTYKIVSEKIHASYSISNLLGDNDHQNASSPPAATLPGKPNTTSALYTTLPAPQHGIYYKVQIAATKKSPERKNDFFRSRYKIDEPVDLSMHEGWKKYMIGTFEKYAAASQHRAETLAKVPDAFVVAYNNGERIPLKEALNTDHRNQ